MASISSSALLDNFSIFILVFAFFIFLQRVRKPAEMEPVPDHLPLPPRRASPQKRFIYMLLLIGLTIAWSRIGSFDKAFKKHFIPPSDTAPNAPSGEDWKMVDGVRWTYIVGTDSAGIGYGGWVSELAFFESSPETLEPDGSSKLLKAMGLPTMAERIQGLKNLKNVRKSLKRSLKNN